MTVRPLRWSALNCRHCRFRVTIPQLTLPAGIAISGFSLPAIHTQPTNDRLRPDWRGPIYLPPSIGWDFLSTPRIVLTFGIPFTLFPIPNQCAPALAARRRAILSPMAPSSSVSLTYHNWWFHPSHIDRPYCHQFILSARLQHTRGSRVPAIASIASPCRSPPNITTGVRGPSDRRGRRSLCRSHHQEIIAPG